jgi:hypothetical protein
VQLRRIIIIYDCSRKKQAKEYFFLDTEEQSNIREIDRLPSTRTKYNNERNQSCPARFEPARTAITVRTARVAPSIRPTRADTIAIAEPVAETLLACFANTKPKRIVKCSRKQPPIGFARTREPAYCRPVPPKLNGIAIAQQILKDRYVVTLSAE